MADLRLMPAAVDVSRHAGRDEGGNARPTDGAGE